MHSAEQRDRQDAAPGQVSKTLNDFEFKLTATLTPLLDSSGAVTRHSPQARFEKAQNSALHQYGSGDFCHFRLDVARGLAGVYVFVAGGEVVYIGECADLRQRFNAGYGNISPRNCFVGGQPTNCRINRFVLDRIEAGVQIDVYFRESHERKLLERSLITTFQPAWNVKHRTKNLALVPRQAEDRLVL